MVLGGDHRRVGCGREGKGLVAGGKEADELDAMGRRRGRGTERKREGWMKSLTGGRLIRVLFLYAGDMNHPSNVLYIVSSHFGVVCK